MDPLIEALYPLVLYIVYSILDSCHSLLIMKAPGTMKGISIYPEIQKESRPIEELFATVENELDFLKSTKDCLKHCGRDLWFLNWVWPFWKKYEWDETFKIDYTDGKKKWWSAKVLSGVFLVLVFLIFMARDYKGGVFGWLEPVRDFFIQSDSEFSFVLLSSVAFFFSLGIYKSVGRVFYRLSLHGIQRGLVFFSQMHSWVGELAKPITNQLEKFFEKNNKLITKDVIAGAFAAYFKDYIDPSFEGAEEILKAIPLITDSIKDKLPDKLDLPTSISIIDYFKEKIDDNLLGYFHQRIREFIIPDIGYSGTTLAYDFEKFSVSSVIRFVLFDSKGSHFLLMLIITVFIISSGFTTTSNLIETKHVGEDEDGDGDGEGEETSTIGMTGMLMVVCAMSAVYICLYLFIIAFLRAVGISMIHSFGRSKRDDDGNRIIGIRSLIASEVSGMYYPNHVYSMPQKVKVGTAVKKVAGDIVFLSFIVPAISFVIIAIYMILNEEAKSSKKQDEGGVAGPNSRLRLQHYIESAKTLTMILSVIIFTYYFFKVSFKKLS